MFIEVNAFVINFDLPVKSNEDWLTFFLMYVVKDLLYVVRGSNLLNSARDLKPSAVKLATVPTNIL